VFFVSIIYSVFCVLFSQILNTITSDILGHDGTFKNTIEQCNFIKKYYQENIGEELYLTIHNIDGTMLRANTVSRLHFFLNLYFSYKWR
jgi:hypothetical protein